MEFPELRSHTLLCFFFFLLWIINKILCFIKKKNLWGCRQGWNLFAHGFLYGFINIRCCSFLTWSQAFFKAVTCHIRHWLERVSYLVGFHVHLLSHVHDGPFFFTTEYFVLSSLLIYKIIFHVIFLGQFFGEFHVNFWEYYFGHFRYKLRYVGGTDVHICYGSFSFCFV